MIKDRTYQIYKYRKAQRRKVARLLFRIALAIAAGVALGFLILGVTEPREAMARMDAQAEEDEPEKPVMLTAAEYAEKRTEKCTESSNEEHNEERAETEPAAETDAEPEGQQDEEPVYLGEFTLTAYCACRKCCGKWSGGPTASGAMPEEGVTVAVDKSVIALGTEIVIDGYGTYTAQDTGSAVKGKHIDIYFASHEAAKQFGKVCGVKVWAR